MKNKARIVATLVGLIIGGISYWVPPYNHLTIFGSYLTLTWSLSSFFVSLVLMFFINEKPLKIALLIFLGVVLAVLSRIIYDKIFWITESHKLALFEIMFCGFVIIPSAYAGGYLALLIKKFTINK